LSQAVYSWENWLRSIAPGATFKDARGVDLFQVADEIDGGR
jgi:hypothetical protein